MTALDLSDWTELPPFPALIAGHVAHHEELADGEEFDMRSFSAGSLVGAGLILAGFWAAEMGEGPVSDQERADSLFAEVLDKTRAAVLAARAAL